MKVDLEIEPDVPAVVAGLDMEPPADDIQEAMPTIGTDGRADVAPMALVEVLGPDIALPILTKFVPDDALRQAAQRATAYALGIQVNGAEGLQRADVALTTLRTSQKAIADHFADPADIANRLHKRITGIRGEWMAAGQDAIAIVGRRIGTEQQRLDAIAAEERRRVQAEADRLARETARKDAAAVAAQHAPAPVVQEMHRRAETATAPPVTVASEAPALQGNSAVKTWKTRLAGTSGDLEPNPAIEALNPQQLGQVKVLLRAILDSTAPIASVEINWSYLNRRATSDKSTLAIPGIEVYQDFGVRAKGLRRVGR